jgi:hypothetical protein
MTGVLIDMCHKKYKYLFCHSASATRQIVLPPHTKWQQFSENFELAKFLFVCSSIYSEFQMPFSQISSKALERGGAEIRSSSCFYYFFHAKQNAYHVIHCDMTSDGVGDVECSHPRWPSCGPWGLMSIKSYRTEQDTFFIPWRSLNLHGNDLPTASLPHHAVINDLFFFYYFADGTGTQKVLQISKL